MVEELIGGSGYPRAHRVERLALLSLKLVKFRDQRKMTTWGGSWEGGVFSLQRQQSPITLHCSVCICLWDLDVSGGFRDRLSVGRSG